MMTLNAFYPGHARRDAALLKRRVLDQTVHRHRRVLVIECVASQLNNSAVTLLRRIFFFFSHRRHQIHHLFLKTALQT